MNKFEQIEIIGVIIIVICQFVIFWRTKLRIDTYKNIFPGEDSYIILKPVLKRRFLRLHPKKILENLGKYIKESDGEPDETHSEDNKVVIDLIGKKNGGNHVTDKIIYALNTYLLRNRGVASDFNLIKDVVDRNSDCEEEHIHLTISLPLYLGLLGTFLGIVIGLFQISGIDFSSGSGALDNAISLLLGGVKIAMIASFSGLLLTILNSGVFLKNAKVSVEENKNHFFTFIQVELLPLLNQSINSTLVSLQQNLFKFNEEFKDNVRLLSGVMGKNYETLKAQEQILTALENIDLTEFAKANVRILQQLQISVKEFSQFNKFLEGLNGMVQHGAVLSNKLQSMIERTDNFHVLGERIITTFQNNEKLQIFLQDHYSSLDESRQLIVKSVGGVGNVIDESLENLKVFTQEKLAEIKKISLHEMDLMQNKYPEKWKNLDYLQLLQVLSKNMDDFKSNNAAQASTLKNEISLMNRKLSDALVTLEAIQKDSHNTVINKISDFSRKVFKRKKLNGHEAS